MKNTHSACAYPVCPVCGKTMLFAEPVVRDQKFLIHLDCRGREAKSPASN